MSEDLESWDLDPDFQLPPEGILLPHSSNQVSTDSLSPPPSAPEEDDQNFFALLDSKLHKKGEGEDRNEKEDSMNSLASTDSTVSSTGTLKGLMRDLTIVDERQSSYGDANVENTESNKQTEEQDDKKPSKMQTIRLGSDLSKLLSSGGGINAIGRGKVLHLGSTPLGKAIEVGDGDWDQDLDFGNAEGTVDEKMEKKDPLGLFVGAGNELRRLEKKASWTSHLSLDDEEEREENENVSEPAPTSTVAPLRQNVSIDSFKDESEEFSDLDFDLPSSQSTFDITPSLALNPRPSLNSTRSESTSTVSQHPRRESSTGSNSSAQTQIASPLALPPLSIAPAPSRLSIISTHSNNTSTSAATTTDDEGGGGGSRATEDSDAEFFQDLELPEYFLGGGRKGSSQRRQGGGGTTTPPTSDGEFSFSEKSPSPSKSHESPFDEQQQSKVDLQGLLKQKLELRGGRGLLFRTTSSGSVSSPTKEQLEGLEKHREREEEDHDAGRELSLSRSREQEGTAEVKADEESWNAEEMRQRMRTISGVRAREAVLARNGRSGSGSNRRMNNTSGGKLPPLPSSTTTSPAKRPITARRSDTGPTESSSASRSIVRSALSRSGSTASVSSQPTHLPPSSSRSSLPHIVRPSSAQSSHSIHTSTAPNRRGPPPAPSAASRDRIRTRTSSLRTVGSHSDIRNPASARPRSGSGTTVENSQAQSPSSPSSHPPRTASAPSATPTVRPRRSSQHFRPLTAPTPGRSIERKRSLQNIASVSTEPQTPSRPGSRQNSLRSPSPASTSRRPSFAAPTASSASRIRERVHSNPHPPPLAVVPASPVPSRTLASTPGGGTSARLLQPTFSSASKTRAGSSYSSLASTPSRPSTLKLSALRIPSQPVHLSRPLSLNRTTPNKNTESYGDGTELDGFDDLPVSKEREKFLLSKTRASLGRPSYTTTDHVNRSNTTRRIDQPLSKGKAAKPLQPVASGLISGVMSRKEGEQLREREKDKGGKRKKREPHLIRHLGGTAGAPKVHGEMTYNPILQRWEGNESVLREFDKVLSTSTRPALISPFSSTLGSPARSGFSSPTLIDSQVELDTPSLPTVVLPKASSGASRGGVKVVGDMVFDPSTCSWHAIAGPEGEDELELDWGDVADDEEGGEGDGWAKGERERMLKNRASFVLSEGEEGSSEEERNGKKGKMTKRSIWRESKRAEERCKEELEGWITYREEGEKEDRSWLYELRGLILDSR